MPWQPQFIIQSANVKHLPEDALHEILIKLAPYTLYYFDSVDGRRRFTIGILMPDLSSFINRQLKSDVRQGDKINLKLWNECYIRHTVYDN